LTRILGISAFHHTVPPFCSSTGASWLFAAGPHGSHGYWVTAVGSPKHGLRWWVHWGVGQKAVHTPNGSVSQVVSFEEPCDSDQLLHRVAEDPRGMPAEDYRYLVNFVTSHPALAKAMAGAKEA
jgi:hypothetical protein